jgi:hypothetical protein
MVKFEKLDRLLDDNEIKSEMRDLKLRMVSGEIDFKINKDFINKNKKIFNFIKNTFPNDVLSGSIVLKAYGLLNRDYHDLDILIDDPKRYSGYMKSDYDNLEMNVSNRLGYKTLSYKNGFFSFKEDYKVDFFENKGSSYNVIDGIKFHSLLEVLDCKMTMALDGYSESSKKHRKDLTDIFRMIYIRDCANF